MTWEVVKAKVLSIVTGVTLLPYEGSDVTHLTALPEGADGEAMPTRSAWVTATGGTLDGPLSHKAGGQRFTTMATLAIKYKKTRNRDRLDVIMADDWERVSLALADVATWDTATSGIISMWNRSGEPAFPRDVVPMGDDTIQVIALAIQYKRQPSE